MNQLLTNYKSMWSFERDSVTLRETFKQFCETSKWTRTVNKTINPTKAAKVTRAWEGEGWCRRMSALNRSSNGITTPRAYVPLVRYIIHVYVYMNVYMHVRRLSLVAAVRHNDPEEQSTSGPRLYLRATVEINETKARTRDGMRCFLSRGRSQNGRIRLYVRAHQDTEAVPTTSLANRVASFRVLAVVKRRSWGVYRLTLALFPMILELKRKCREGLQRTEVGGNWRFAELIKTYIRLLGETVIIIKAQTHLTYH